jgi:hypothetical protein
MFHPLMLKIAQHRVDKTLLILNKSQNFLSALFSVHAIKANALQTCHRHRLGNDW